MNTRITRTTLLTGIVAGVSALTVPDLFRSPLPVQAPDPYNGPATRAGWRKVGHEPVLGGKLGTCFDVCLLHEGGFYRMWFSWRPKGSIALTESRDGVHWARPRIVLAPRLASGWEDIVNRPSVIRVGDVYHLWYTGQTATASAIGHAVSPDGVRWTRTGREPVFGPRDPWELRSVMCPDVLWDPATASYRMWYSAGHQFEPDAIGYATSRDGITWRRHGTHPVFKADARFVWERHKVTACQVIRDGAWHLMFYIGFSSDSYAHIGLARSHDGIGGWQRHPLNPIISPSHSDSAWDRDAVYKPFALRTAHGWSLWYNGRRGAQEQIGLATHDGRNLW